MLYCRLLHVACRQLGHHLLARVERGNCAQVLGGHVVEAELARVRRRRFDHLDPREDVQELHALLHGVRCIVAGCPLHCCRVSVALLHGARCMFYGVRCTMRVACCMLHHLDPRGDAQEVHPVPQRVAVRRDTSPDTPLRSRTHSRTCGGAA